MENATLPFLTEAPPMRKLLKAVTCHIEPIFPFFQVAQAPGGLLRAVTCLKRGACATGGVLTKLALAHCPGGGKVFGEIPPVSHRLRRFNTKILKDCPKTNDQCSSIIFGPEKPDHGCPLFHPPRPSRPGFPLTPEGWGGLVWSPEILSLVEGG